MRRTTSTLTALVATLAIVLLPALDASAARPVKPPKPTPSPTVTTTPPPPPTGLYVALGDSYAAGTARGPTSPTSRPATGLPWATRG